MLHGVREARAQEVGECFSARAALRDCILILSVGCDSVFNASQTPEEVKSGKRPAVKLAVDGYAMLYYLYFSHNFNCVCGGQYAQFAEYTRTYVGNLLKCGFSPFVSDFSQSV